jgi:chromosomal replication initiation ATPase DnaA
MSEESYSRTDLIVAPANARAVAFVDSWPNWPVSVAALYGPRGCGKTHLALIWQKMSGACLLCASELDPQNAAAPGPLVIEDVDRGPVTPARDTRLFAALECANLAAPLLLTGTEPPTAWPCVLPDLKSRFAAMASLPLGAPDEALLAAIARKLFADRQLAVPDAVIEHILRIIERSPAAVREFVATADAAALARGRPVTLPLVRAVIATRENGQP